jgi:hypothetical protein
MPNRAELALDRLHARVRANPLLQRFTVCTRILLAVGFIPPSLVKIQGERFTTMPIEHPVGFFFEAMYRTGAYWSFIGWAQLAGAALLLHPRTATLGALLFFPIILNIFAITVSMHFAGTWVITGLMLLACTYLLCWDYDRFKPLLWAPARPARALAPRVRTLERIAYGVMTVSALGVTLMIRGYVPPRWALVLLAAGFAGGVCLLAAGMMELRARRAAGFAREGVAG